MDASDLASAEYWLSWIATAKLVAAFLVAAGVVIEFGGDWLARPYERVVNNARESRMAALATDAERARSEIAKANATAAEANKQTARLEQEAEAARGQIADATKAAAAANERAANLEREAAAANERTAQIMHAAAWRQFTPEQIASLGRSFAQSKGKITISWSPNDSEALDLAIQFTNIFDGAIREKWQLSAGSQPAVVTSIVWGIDIPDVPSAAEIVAAVRKAFLDAGVPFQTAPLPQQPSGVFFGGPPPGTKGEGSAIIFFGSKRPSFGQPPF